MTKSKMDEAAAKSTSKYLAMLAANKCSLVTSNSSAMDERRSRKFSNHKNMITPEVRIVYVYEPKIINTDPENFRSLVQKLTGKSSHKSKARKRQTNHKSPSSALIAAEISTDNLENMFSNNDQPPTMENKATKFSEEYWPGLPEGFCDMDMILPSLMNQGLLNELPLISPGLVNEGLSSEIITAEDGAENFKYTFYSNDQVPSPSPVTNYQLPSFFPVTNDQVPITENIATICSTEDCNVFFKVFSDTDMVFPSLMNPGLLDEIPLIWNNS